jgi:hypothetical protein
VPALLTTLCITCCNQRLHFYNHEVVLVPFFAAGPLLA